MMIVRHTHFKLQHVKMTPVQLQACFQTHSRLRFDACNGMFDCFLSFLGYQFFVTVRTSSIKFVNSFWLNTAVAPTVDGQIHLKYTNDEICSLFLYYAFSRAFSAWLNICGPFFMILCSFCIGRLGLLWIHKKQPLVHLKQGNLSTRNRLPTMVSNFRRLWCRFLSSDQTKKRVGSSTAPTHPSFEFGSH